MTNKYNNSFGFDGFNLVSHRKKRSFNKTLYNSRLKVSKYKINKVVKIVNRGIPKYYVLSRKNEKLISYPYDEDDINKNHNHVVKFNDYFGFSVNKYRNQSEKETIYFNIKSYRDLTGLSNRDIETISPKKGDYICGTCKKRNGKLYYNKWFICSPQFVQFVILLKNYDNIKDLHKYELDKLIFNNFDVNNNHLIQDKKDCRLFYYNLLKNIYNNRVNDNVVKFLKTL